VQLIRYDRSEQEVQLTGYSGRSTGVVELVTFDHTQRLRRAWLGRGTGWLAALAAVMALGWGRAGADSGEDHRDTQTASRGDTGAGNAGELFE
jgi:hypothetical protein